ncbi:hypothetical protein WS70_23880 [Burkholderia mayonis]|uniref:Uncharacterized protein n=1 Tax=Burkholderia mayonis TaxID=1385591 RepID=A0A1B4FMB7_9BURK|nr:hypothetical protein WS70_23880 [Burkholderia mayonis]KVE36771.1 hypothetical protein WS69_11360 [Burkholderia sp. BDU5]KVE41339.1 hypothetical protein WS70_15100 [Burkholderia mayonis]
MMFRSRAGAHARRGVRLALAIAVGGGVSGFVRGVGCRARCAAEEAMLEFQHVEIPNGWLARGPDCGDSTGAR